MSRKSAAKRGKALKRQLQGVRIATQLPVRTLRPSAERKIAKERAPHLWIYPGLENAAYKFGTTHPRTSFLGLPTEIRQQILYMSLNMKDLEVAAADEIATKEETTRKLTAIRKLRTDKLAQLAFHKGEIKFLKAFCRHTTLL
ncbi:hypothetical protein J1614_011397 [Plenodomus biglobosus]|nr:hypothetical protein J1614_011397 [Plenodomus biglobosus]